MDSFGHIAIVLLAAGASTRMRGLDKLLEDIDGLPLLARQARAALQLYRPVLVTLAPTQVARRAVLDDLNVEIVDVPDAASGMSASIRAAMLALPTGLDGVAILPADMPEIGARELTKVMAGFRDGQITRGASEDGVPGHPVIFPKRCFPALCAVQGDIGARAVIQGEDVTKIPLPGQAALLDLDTPEDWANWRADQAKR